LPANSWRDNSFSVSTAGPFITIFFFFFCIRRNSRRLFAGRIEVRHWFGSNYARCCALFDTRPYPSRSRFLPFPRGPTLHVNSRCPYPSASGPVFVDWAWASADFSCPFPVFSPAFSFFVLFFFPFFFFLAFSRVSHSDDSYRHWPFRRSICETPPIPAPLVRPRLGPPRHPPRTEGLPLFAGLAS